MKILQVSKKNRSRNTKNLLLDLSSQHSPPPLKKVTITKSATELEFPKRKGLPIIPKGTLRRRRTTLALTIPSIDENTTPKISTTNEPPYSPKSSPTNNNTSTSFCFGNTVINHNASKKTVSNPYDSGPVCVLEPNLYLYSEPTLDQLDRFDVVINVAKEIPNYQREIRNKGKTYYFVPWTHTSNLCPDLPLLTSVIENSLSSGKATLIHCQCGVSRSASLIVAYLMKKYGLNLNDAYNRLKVKAPSISPNMNLIFYLAEWGKTLEAISLPASPYST
ncbi:hypothetical protein LJB42_002671 [Komagataella kurtzmanii]|nr:hypothetical protein LJB42_002671 [Komagataella kurtzmanii]